jgi:hypothetical protein
VTRGLIVAVVLLAGCTAGRPTPTPTSLEVDAVAQRYAAYTPERAEREGYKRDAFCLDAESFGQAPAHGAMGFHATNETLLRGPIDAHRPQALLFDVHGRALGVEYEIMVDAVRGAPQLFGRSFVKLPPHAGVQHEHYALHLWFIENPSGQFADFNPRVSCPPGSTPAQGSPQPHGGPESTLPPPEHGAGH